MRRGFLIYHPARKSTQIDDWVVYHDAFGGNEDPYIWNKRFLHSYCHITQLSNEPGQINFWVSGDRYPYFEKLLCDCVFWIEEKVYWRDSNKVSLDESIVDNAQTFEHHFKWGGLGEHPFLRRRRYTLKGHPEKSYQPQNSQKGLIDILPFLNEYGISTESLIIGMTSKRGSKPFRLPDDITNELYGFIESTSEIKLLGNVLAPLHPYRIPDSSQKNTKC
jgi:hypothetical protein